MIILPLVTIHHRYNNLVTVQIAADFSEGKMKKRSLLL